LKNPQQKMTNGICGTWIDKNAFFMEDVGPELKWKSF
jgi:hypothetical protein